MFKNWQTTLAGIAAALTTWAPVFNDWFHQNAGHIGVLQVLGLVLMIAGMLQKDGHPIPSAPPTP